MDGSWSIQEIDISDKREVSMLDLDELSLIQDIKGIPYQTSFKAISHYKTETLKDLCSDKNISLTIKDTGKKKRKEQLYHATTRRMIISKATLPTMSARRLHSKNTYFFYHEKFSLILSITSLEP